MDTPSKTSFTYTLTPDQQELLTALLVAGNYRRVEVPHTRIAAKGDKFIVNLYKSGKCLVQGQLAEEFVLFTLEPLVLQSAAVGYEEVLNPESVSPHMGSDESGKGDFFGPLVIAAVYVNPEIAAELQAMGMKDSKLLNDKQSLAIGAKARQLLTPTRFKIVMIGPQAYNRLYLKIRNVNNLLAWGHARAIENMLDSVPDCPRAVADQFGRTKAVIERALMKKGRSIVLEQMHKAESDIAVAAASVLAREVFLTQLRMLGAKLGVELPKGASPQVKAAAEAVVRKHGPAALVDAAKCHFKTTDQVLAACGASRADLGELGQATSRAKEEGGE